jgi:hypothetical protein
MFLKHFVNKTKDAILQVTARKFILPWIINKYHLKQLGNMTTLRLDCEKQEILIALDLHGEQDPIELTIRYQVLSPTCIEIKDVRSSRNWIATLVNEVLPAEQKRIEQVPTAVTTLLSKVIH